MTENLIKQTPEVPLKFQDEDGSLKTQELLKSYLELEKKFAQRMTPPADDAPEEEKRSFYHALGVPDSPDEYKIEVKHKLLASNPEVNAKLCALGFTNKQAQAVYDLAAEKVLPIIEDLASDYEADRQRASLIKEFGSEDKWNEISQQLYQWGKQNLSETLLDALSTTCEGVMALYHMMQTKEPILAYQGPGEHEALSEAGLKKMMMDPKYWKEQDPELVAKVAKGFDRLYPSKTES